MATTTARSSHTTLYTGSGTNDNDVVIQTDVIERHGAYMLMSTTGAMDVFVSLDGTNYTTAALSLIDFGGIVTTPVLVTVANRLYAFRGVFRFIRVLQNGATAVANAAMLAGEV